VVYQGYQGHQVAIKRAIRASKQCFIYAQFLASWLQPEDVDFFCDEIFIFFGQNSQITAVLKSTIGKFYRGIDISKYHPITTTRVLKK